MRSQRLKILVCMTTLLFLAIGVPPQASEDITLEVILEKWATALGGRQALQSVNLQHRTSDIKMYGMDGTMEEWRAGDGRYHNDLNLAGIFSITIVNNGVDYWLLDQNKKVSRQAGQDLQNMITTAYFDTWEHLLDDPSRGSAAYEGVDDASGHYVVSFHPEGGIEARVLLSAKTFLPVQTVSPSYSGETATTTFEDWREFGGIMYPVKMLVSDGTPQNDQSFTITAVDLDEYPPPGIFDKPGESGDNITFAAGVAARDIPIDLNGVHIYVQVGLNDSDPLWFVLDTGASVTVIDETLAKEKGFALEGKIMAGGSGEKKAEVSFIRDAAFMFPGVEISGQTVATVKLREILEARAGRPVDGILGYDMISRFVIEIDYIKGRMHLFDRKTWEYNGNGEIVPIEIVGSVPHCQATIVAPGRDPVEATFLVDTGSGGSLSFTRPFTTRNDLLSIPERTLHTSGGMGIGGKTRQLLGRIPELRIGELSFKQIVCGFSQDEKGSGADETIAGLLGGLILEQCTVILDYENERIILEPNERYGNSVERALSGLTITTDGRADWHKFTISHVLEKSAGAKAGCKPGDVIVEIDGRPASEIHARDLARLLRENGRTLSLKISRGGKIHERQLELKPVL